MERKVLIAVDGSRHSENALRYAAGLREPVENLKFVLFHVEYGTALLYDAIVVGRRGLSGLAEVLVGSVSRYLVSQFSGGALWVVP